MSLQETLDYFVLSGGPGGSAAIAGDVLSWTVALDAVKWARDSGTGIATALAPLELVPYIGLSSAGALSVGPSYPATPH